LKKDIKKLKFLVLALGTCAAALISPAQNANAEIFNAEQTKEIEVLFKKFLSDNPELILKSVDDFRSVQEKKTQQSAQKNLEEYASYFADENLPSAGNPKGDVTIVEYFDYNCGYCRKAFADIVKIIEEDKNIRVIFQEMPILSPSSIKMASIAMAAHKQGKYFEMHAALMDYKGGQSDSAFYGVAEKLGLDIEKLKADAASADVKAQIRKATDMARSLDIRGTPGFIIGNKIYPGYIGLDGLRDAVKAARANKAKGE